MPTLGRDGVAIHYDVHTADPGRTPLLLSHGFASSSAMWAPNVAALGADRTVITWDLRGHGETDSPSDPSCYSAEASIEDMVAILDACGVTHAVIGGHSLGGYLSLAFHLAHPERTAALLLCNTGPGFKQDGGRAEWNDMAEGLARRHPSGGLALAARGILPQHDASVITSLPHVAVPTLVVVGEHDHQFLAAADYMAAKTPGAAKVVVADAGHVANVDQPEAFNDAVVRFLDQVADAPPP